VANVGLDYLPSNLITQGTSQRLEMIELRAPRHPFGENLIAQLARNTGQQGPNVFGNCCGILAHFCTPV
jgi:hypothetical protein